MISGGWLLLLIVGLVAAVFVALFVGMQLTADKKLRRQLANARHRMIGELADLQAGRIIGTAHRHDAVLTAPLSGRTCVYFIARLEHRFGEHWRELVREEKSVPFVLRDSSGAALIDPTSARISLETDEVSQSGEVAEDLLDPRQQAFLERHQKLREGREHFRYYEAVIAEGEQIAVYGSGLRETGPDGSSRLRMTSSAARPLVISDYASTTTGR